MEKSKLAPVSPSFFPNILSTGRSLLVAHARTSILSSLEGCINIGQLQVREQDRTYVFGPGSQGARPAIINVQKDSFWLRVLMSVDVGFGEAYMLGDIDIEDLRAVMNIFIDNNAALPSVSSVLDRLFVATSSFASVYLGQTKSQARLNAIASYDVSNELFKAFLSDEMMYSCALWSKEEGGFNGDLNAGPKPGHLEAAQRRKIHYILRKARVKPGHRLLEFGTGWGALAIEAARAFGCIVDTLTLSAAQKTLAEERIYAAGLQDKIRVHLMDYRDIPPEFEKAFDAFVSSEMVEHVGPKYWNTYFRLIDWALKPEHATAVMTSSTQPESRYMAYQSEDFARKYIWPRTTLPSPTALISAANAGSQGRLNLEGIENHGFHYARTLREWGYRFDANISQVDFLKNFQSLSNAGDFISKQRKVR